ncbi:MAG TPA: hypothetical protein VHA53_04785 [Nitrolancea sp.]|nr:hypothetical protein [Nitrolancea sp.]
MLGSLVAVIALVIVFISTVSLENHLPSLRIAEPPTAGTTTRVLEPGSYRADDPAIVRTGNWFPQTLGSTTSTDTSMSMVTSTGGSTMTLVFYGTDVSVDARIGPESGKIRVSIDGGTSAILPSDDKGSFVDLGGAQAEETSILLATGLSHHDHTLVIQSMSDVDVAVSRFDVTASTPFPWAFTVLYSGLAMLLFVVVRSAVIVMSQDRGWLR